MGEETHVVQFISNNGVPFGLHQVQPGLRLQIARGQEILQLLANGLLLLNRPLQVGDIAGFGRLAGLAGILQHFQPDALEHFFDFFANDHRVEVPGQQDFLVAEGV